MPETISDMIFYRKIEAEEEGHALKQIVLTGGEAYSLFYELQQEGAPLEVVAQVNGITIHGVIVLLNVGF